MRVRIEYTIHAGTSTTQQLVRARDSDSLVDIEFDFVEIFLWAFSGSVVVVETTVLSAKLLNVVIVCPSINLLENRECNEV